MRGVNLTSVRVFSNIYTEIIEGVRIVNDDGLSNFCEADLSYAIFRDTTLPNVDMRGSLLKSMNLWWVVPMGVLLAIAMLFGSILSGMIYIGIILSG